MVGKCRLIQNLRCNNCLLTQVLEKNQLYMKYLFLTAIFFVFGCTSDENETFILSDQEYIFKIDRTLDPGTKAVSQFDESDFVALDQASECFLIFSEEGKKVSFIDEGIAGYAEKNIPFQVSFYLDEGLFAAGRLKIWKDGDVLNAEYMVFGSGVPVLSAVRGYLVLAD